MRRLQQLQEMLTRKAVSNTSVAGIWALAKKGKHQQQQSTPLVDTWVKRLCQEMLLMGLL
jgi:hypothetical protein